MPNNYEDEWDSLAGLSSYYEQTLPKDDNVEEPLRPQDVAPLLNFQSIENAAIQFRAVMNKYVEQRASQPLRAPMSEAEATQHEAKLDAQYADIQAEYLRGVAEEDTFKWLSPGFGNSGPGNGGLATSSNFSDEKHEQRSENFGNSRIGSRSNTNSSVGSSMVFSRRNNRSQEHVSVTLRKHKRELSEDDEDDEVEERLTKFHFRPTTYSTAATPALCALSRDALLGVIGFLRVDEVLRLSGGCRHLHTALAWWNTKYATESTNQQVDMVLNSWDDSLKLLANPNLENSWSG